MSLGSKHTYDFFFFFFFFFFGGGWGGGRGPWAFLIWKFTDVNPEFAKFSKYTHWIIFSNVTYLIKVFHLKSLNDNL